jgi:hypothetical protein
MAKAAKKRAGKKRKAKKSAGKKARKAAPKKAASKKAAPKAKRKAAKAKSARPKAAKRKPMPKAPMMSPSRGGESWPMVFAVVVALLAGIAVMWHFGGITIAAAATLPMQMPAPVAGLVYAGCDVVAAADTWLALAHADLAPGLK